MIETTEEVSYSNAGTSALSNGQEGEQKTKEQELLKQQNTFADNISKTTLQGQNPRCWRICFLSTLPRTFDIPLSQSIVCVSTGILSVVITEEIVGLM